MKKQKQSSPLVRFGLTIAVIAIMLALTAKIASAGPGGSAFSTIVVVVVLIQVVGWAVATVLRTERFFDAVGAASWVLATVIALMARPGGADAFAWVLGLVMIAWAVRLGAFLSWRGMKFGDDRFDEIKTNPLRFLSVWLIQALWITLVGGAGLVAILSPERPGGTWFFAVVGWVIALVGLGIEAIADQQKSRFKLKRANRGRFINEGLWARSQHPNYFGEILVWTGVALAALLPLAGWQHLLLVSPLFITLLLTKVSGIPQLDAKAKQRYGDDPAWQRYFATTPKLVPKLK